MKKHKTKNKNLSVRREAIRFLGSAGSSVRGGYQCGDTGGPEGDGCTTGCSVTGCTNSEVISY